MTTVTEGVIIEATNPGPTQFVDTGYPSIGFLILSAALVFVMTPGVGMFYSGLVSSKHALSLIYVSFLCMAVVTIQWFLFGFSLSFSETGSSFIGNFKYGAFAGIDGGALPISSGVPGIVFALYQLQFAAVTPAIIFGSIAGRIKLIPSIVFIFIWTTIVYDPIASWTWGANGWLAELGAIDFAGGGPVHIASGFAGLALCVFLGKRSNTETRPHNVSLVFLGTVLIWFGWFAFNGGSAVNATPRAAMAAFVTTLCASFSGITWALFDFAFTKKLSGVSFCCGAIAGLVVITPGSGFVSPWASAVMGILGGVIVNLMMRLKDYLGYDDALDALGIHGFGGIVGNILTGIFHQKWVVTLDGGESDGGAIDGNGVLVGYQIAGSLACAAYAFVVTYIIVFLLSFIPGLSFKSEGDDDTSSDIQEMGETAYMLEHALDGALEAPTEKAETTPVTEE